MKEEKIYSASADVAERAQCIESSYRTADGRYIISEKTLRDLRFQMTAEEFVTGVDVIIVTKDEAERLIKEGGYMIGRTGTAVTIENDTSTGEFIPEENAPEEHEEAAEGSGMADEGAGDPGEVEPESNEEEEE